METLKAIFKTVWMVLGIGIGLMIGVFFIVVTMALGVLMAEAVLKSLRIM